METKFLLNAIKENKAFPANITLSNKDKNVVLSYESNGINLSFISEYPFFALVELRQSLEELGFLLACNGARKDVYPSGMSINGIMAYELKMGEPAKKLVNIFDSVGDLNKLTSVSEQKKYRDNWLKSIE